MHPECRYCDTGFYPTIYEGDRICASCGAEWNPVMVEDKPLEEDFGGWDEFIENMTPDDEALFDDEPYLEEGDQVDE